MDYRKGDPFGLNKVLGLFIDPRIAERKKEEARRNSKDRYHAKKLAKELNIELTIEKDAAGWCCRIEYHVDQVGPKGWKDELFCCSWGEVRNKLETMKKERDDFEMGPDDRQQATVDKMAREIQERIEMERSRKSIQAVREMMLVLNKT